MAYFVERELEDLFPTTTSLESFVKLLPQLFFILLAILFTVPIVVVSLVILFYPDPFRQTKDSLKQTPYFYYTHKNEVKTKKDFVSLIQTSTDERPVFVLFGSKRCSAFAGAYVLFHKFFIKYNVYVVYDENALLIDEGMKAPVLLKFGNESNILDKTQGLWDNKKMAEMIGFEEEEIKIIG